MSISLILSKFKSLTPVAVVASAVVVTVKLLTTQTPTNQEELKVAAEEDIDLVDFKDEIVIPPPPPEPEVPEEKKEEAKKEESEESDDEDEQDSEESSQGDEQQQPQENQEQEKQEKEKKKSKPRQFIKGNKFSEMLSRLLSKDKKK